MKLALLSDIHANLHALDACLAHAEAAGAQGYALLGDLVGYGAFPGEVVARCQALVAAGAAAVQGNHDHYALVDPSQAQKMAHTGVAWTQQQLGPAERAFLGALPMTARMGSALLVHASADAPERWHYVTDSNAAERSMAAATQLDPAIRYVFCGHVHEQALYFLTPTAKLMRFSPQPGVPVPVPPHRQWLAIAGSCGQPRDGDTRAMYALFDPDAATITFQRVAYNHAAAAAAVRASGLPTFFADRLERGR